MGTAILFPELVSSFPYTFLTVGAGQLSSPSAGNKAPVRANAFNTLYLRKKARANMLAQGRGPEPQKQRLRSCPSLSKPVSPPAGVCREVAERPCPSLLTEVSSTQKAPALLRHCLRRERLSGSAFHWRQFVVSRGVPGIFTNSSVEPTPAADHWIGRLAIPPDQKPSPRLPLPLSKRPFHFPKLQKRGGFSDARGHSRSRSLNVTQRRWTVSLFDPVGHRLFLSRRRLEERLGRRIVGASARQERFVTAIS
jgi:hypothetical protein